MQNRGVKTWEEFLDAVRQRTARRRGVVLAQPAHLGDLRALVRGGRARPLHPRHGAAQGCAALAALGPVRRGRGHPRGRVRPRGPQQPRDRRGLRDGAAGTQRAARRPRASTGASTNAWSRACWPSRAWSGAAASRCRWAWTSGGYAAARSRSWPPAGARRPCRRGHRRARVAAGARRAHQEGDRRAAARGGARRAGLHGPAPRCSGSGAARQRRRPTTERHHHERRTRTPAAQGAGRGSRSRRRPGRARPRRAPAHRGDHVLPRRGADAAALDRLLRRAVRQREPLRRRRQLRGRLDRRPAVRRAAHPADPRTASSTAPGWRWSATSGVRCSSCTTWCCSATPTSSSSRTRTGTPA